MAGGIRQIAEADATSGGSIQCTLAQVPLAGNSLIVIVAWSDSTQTCTISGCGQTWGAANFSMTSGAASIRAFSVVNVSSPSGTTVTATIGASVGYPTIFVAELTGVGASVVTPWGPGTNVASPTTGASGTLSSQPACAFAFCYDQAGAVSVTPPSGWTDGGGAWDFGAGTNYARFAYTSLASTSPVTATFQGADSTYQLVAYAFAEAGGGATALPPHSAQVLSAAVVAASNY